MTPRPHERPRHDRAVGALLGAPAAAALEAPHAKPHPPPALERLTHAALEELTTREETPHPPTDPTDRAWVRALRALARTGTPPEHLPELDDAPHHDPRGASWKALTRTPPTPHDPAHGSFACDHLVQAVRAAHHAHDLPTALYTGALAGALWGASALPARALRGIGTHTDPHTPTTEALRLAGPTPDEERWPLAPLNSEDGHTFPSFAVPHPLDPHVLLGDMEYLRNNPHAVDTVVSLCRTHPDDAPHLPHHDWLRFWLHDSSAANANLHFTLNEAAAAVTDLRAQGRRVLLHCWAGASRTPAVATRYAVTALGAPLLPTMADMIRTVGGHLDNPSLSRAVAELDGRELPDPAKSLFNGHLPPRRTPTG
ncbi:dual specificity protein phosphatase family protein [Nocardiopsis alba]|uniref:protein-tyrosine phosphatase family protein n=1 Tax=Nocardiopsis alba TaxID=53437 RepID=UPI00340EE4B0